VNEIIKIGQMSDLHFGYRQYGKFERLKDLYEAAMTAAEVLIEHSPDIVIIPGDIFHRSRPYPVSQRQSFRIFERFQEENIQVFVIRVNHDASYIWSERWGGNELHVLNDLGLVTYLEDECREVQLDHNRMVRIWGLGYHGAEAGSNLTALVDENRKALEDKSMPNILMIHEFLDNMVPAAALSEYSIGLQGFDYVGIGHYHRWWVNGAKNMCCSGSTEHMSVADWKEKKRSVALVSFEKVHNKWRPQIERLQYGVRPKLRKNLNLGTVTAEDVTDVVTKTLHEMEIEGAVVRVDVSGTLVDTQQSVDVRSIVQQFTNALHIDIVSQMEYAGLIVMENVSDEAVMKEVFNQRLDVPKSQAGRWVKLATDLKEILTESYDDEGESASIKLLYDFIEAKPVKKKRRGSKR
jgi:DNA repair exonuclease SbcCD nuclease subunit